MNNCQLSDRIEALSHLSWEWARISSQEAERMIAQTYLFSSDVHTPFFAFTFDCNKAVVHLDSVYVYSANFPPRETQMLFFWIIAHPFEFYLQHYERDKWFSPCSNDTYTHREYREQSEKEMPDPF